MPRRLVDSAVWTTLAPLMRETAGMDATVLLFHVWTGPHSTLIGFGRLPIAYLASDLGWPPRRVRKAVDLLETHGLMHFDRTMEIFWLPIALRAQPLQNPRQVDGALRVLHELPYTPLLAALHRELLSQRSDRRSTQRSDGQYLEPLLKRLEERLRSNGDPAPAPGTDSGTGTKTVPETVPPTDDMTPEEAQRHIRDFVHTTAGAKRIL